MILCSSYWLRLKKLILASHVPVQCKHSWPWYKVCMCSHTFLGDPKECQSHQPHIPGSVLARKKWNPAAGPLLVTACVYLVLFPGPECTVQAKDQFPAGRSMAFGGPRSEWSAKGHHPRLQNCLADGLGTSKGAKKRGSLHWFSVLED